MASRKLTTNTFKKKENIVIGQYEQCRWCFCRKYIEKIICLFAAVDKNMQSLAVQIHSQIEQEKLDFYSSPKFVDRK